MEKISRRAALGSVTASALVGIGAKASAEKPERTEPQSSAVDPERPVRSMTLEEFQKMDTPLAVEDLFSHIEGHSFMNCHKDMKKKHGIWIPELVPVFEKLDAMRAQRV